MPPPKNRLKSELTITADTSNIKVMIGNAPSATNTVRLSSIIMSESGT